MNNEPVKYTTRIPLHLRIKSTGEVVIYKGYLLGSKGKSIVVHRIPGPGYFYANGGIIVAISDVEIVVPQSLED